MNKRQIELLNLIGLKINGNNIEWKKDSLASIYFDQNTKLFNIKIKEHDFIPGDYDSIEYLTIDLNQMLGLIYELNMIKDGISNEN